MNQSRIVIAGVKSGNQLWHANH